MTDLQPPRASRLRRRVAGAARRTARRLHDDTPLGRLRRPAVSVILPIYNVEDYLPECLDSLAAQHFGDYEVVVVDDGSPDSSRAIAEDHAARDRRIRIVTKPNGGLGSARNVGVRHARGEFLTFVDSDDVLPAHALRVLVASARETGSDIVVGGVSRFDRSRTWRPDWVPRVHGRRRTSIKAVEFLPLLRNLYTWNKLFRRDFYLAQGLSFREGVAYEDQPIITQLFARARSIDVIPETVYHYRLREDLSSISQQTATMEDLRDRVLAWQVSREVLKAEAPPEIYAGWLQTLVDAHFHWYLGSAGTVDDDYWQLLHSTVLDFLADATPQMWDSAMPDKRVQLELARTGRREDMQEFVRRDTKRLERWPTRLTEDGVLVELPFLGDPDLDDSLFLIRPEQLTLGHAVENVHWVTGADGDVVCRISGWGFVTKVDLAVNQAEVALLLRSPDGTDHRFPSSATPPPAYHQPVEDWHCDYGPGRFQVDLPLGGLMSQGPARKAWQVLLEVTVGGFTVVEPVVTLLRAGSAGVIPAADLGDGRRLVADWSLFAPLRFRMLPATVEALDVAVEGRTLTGRLGGPSAGDVERVTVHLRKVRAEGKAFGEAGERRFRVDLPPAPELGPGGSDTWELSARSLEDRPVPVVLPGPMGVRATQPVAGGELAVVRTREGTLAVGEWRTGALAERLEVTDEGVVRVRGRVFGPPAATVSLASQHLKARAEGPEVPVDGVRFTAELPLEHALFRFGQVPLPTGDHDLRIRVRVGSGAPVEVPLHLAPQLVEELPVPVRTARQEGRVVRGPVGEVRITLLRPVGDGARGRYHQRRLQATPPSSTLTRGVLFRSYFGESATDNGVSIHKELRRRGSDLPVYWAVQDHSVPVPEDGIPVVVGSADYYRLMESVFYYVDNMYQPEHFTKPSGQVLVQTFHGYPFKVMGHPHWRNVQFSQAKIQAYDDRAAEWDYLVSPATYATPLLVRDFAYPGEVLEIGYPRNDVLQSAEAGDLRARTRAALGIAEGQTAVLYAPTFRDYLAVDDMSAAMARFFDAALAHRLLGDDFVLLVRGHAFNARTDERIGQLPGTVDVTDYPEVSDLYLAADAAVVDYSSLRFDFGVTGKPMVFLVPDLQRYKDTRGWLFDFEPTAPGPLVSSTEEVVEALLDLEGVQERYAAAYASFKRTYLDLEDGKAGARFVDRVFVPRGDA